MITAVIVDSKEPEWVQKLEFGGVPTSVAALDVGDLLVATDDGCMLYIERKTPDDFLNSLKDDRLLVQCTRLAEKRTDEVIIKGFSKTFPYLVITGELRRGAGGNVVTDHRETGWNYSAVQGALLSIQEMGVYIVQSGGDMDFEDCIIRLGKRSRDEINLIPARPSKVLGPEISMIAALPGIGVEKAMAIMEWAGGKPAHALCGLTDLDIKAPVGNGTRKRIRNILGLDEKEEISIMYNQSDEQIIEVTVK